MTSDEERELTKLLIRKTEYILELEMANARQAARIAELEGKLTAYENLETVEQQLDEAPPPGGRKKS